KRDRPNSVSAASAGPDSPANVIFPYKSPSRDRASWDVDSSCAAASPHRTTSKHIEMVMLLFRCMMRFLNREGPLPVPRRAAWSWLRQRGCETPLPRAHRDPAVGDTLE